MEELNRSHAVEQIELFAEVDLGRHLDIAGPAHGGEAHGAEENGVGLANAAQGGGGEWVAAAEKLGGADGVFDEVEADVGEHAFDRAEDLDAFGHNFGSDTVSAEDRDFEPGDRTSNKITRWRGIGQKLYQQLLVSQRLIGNWIFRGIGSGTRIVGLG